MKKTILLSVFCFFTLMLSAQKSGIGIIVGEPTGISYKQWMGTKNSFDAALAWSYDNYMHIHADYLFENGKAFNVADLNWYWGVGGRVILHHDVRLGIRVPVGLEYLFENNQFGAFGEIAPTFNLVPFTDFYVEGGIGVRYYFK